MELLPPTIQNPALLGLLGTILGHNADSASVPGLRVRLMGDDFSWHSLIDLAIQQDVLPPLIHALSRSSLLPPVPRATKHCHDGHVTLRLQQYYRDHLARRELERIELQKVVRILYSAGIVPLILKGARYLVAPIGTWCEARTIRDIDLLVPRNQARQAFAALVAEGYRAGQPYMTNYHHLPHLQCPGEPASIEIHTDFLAADSLSVMSTEFAWKTATKAVDDMSFVLPPKWHALHCLLHHQLSDRGYARRILGLKPLWEWTMITRDLSRDEWQEIATYMRAAGAIEPLGSWLVQSQRLFGAPIDEFTAISSEASQNAVETIELAFASHWRRRAKFIADQLRFSFSRDMLAVRYGKATNEISAVDAARYLIHLVRSHRGRLLRRLIGHRDRPS